MSSACVVSSLAVPPCCLPASLRAQDLVEIEDWNEYGELKQHVKIYYDQHTIPSIHDKPPEPPKPKQKAAAKPKAVPAAPKASSSAQSASSKSKPDDEGSKPDPAKPSVLTVRSVADEAAQKAKELRLRALREKVHGKGATSDTKKAVAAADDAGEKSETKAASSDAEPAAATNQQSETPDATAAQCLQSPTSRVWKGSATAREPVQSPTSARWRPCSADLTAPASRTGEATGAKSEKVELSETVVTKADAGA